MQKMGQPGPTLALSTITALPLMRTMPSDLGMDLLSSVGELDRLLPGPTEVLKAMEIKMRGRLFPTMGRLL